MRLGEVERIIVPENLCWEVGGEVKFRVERKTLASAEVKVVSKSEGKEIAQVVTNENGFGRFSITSEGEWMFLVRHRDPTKKSNRKYDESVFISTLVVKVSKLKSLTQIGNIRE